MTLTKRQEKAIEEVRLFINSIPPERMTIARLMDYSKLSEDKLTKGFKQMYDQTIYQYQLQVAMDYAGELLQKGEPIKFVAGRLGYASAASFIRAFFKVYGMNPSRYLDEICSQ